MSGVVRSRERREAMVVRSRWLGATVGLALASVICAYWVVQGVHGARYGELAEHNRLRRQPVRAPRGVIADVAGRPLAENVPSYNLRLHPRRSASLAESVDFVETTLGLPTDQLPAIEELERARSAERSVLVAEDLTLAHVAKVELSVFEHPEFEVDVEQLRLYRHREQTAHVLGYLGEVGEDDLADRNRGYLSGELVGRRGVERAHEATLRGEHGERMVIVDNRGRTVEEFGYESAAPGEGLRLAIDLDLQQTAYRMLDGRVGAIVALDPRDGSIRVMVSSPSYDPNLFARRLDSREWAELVEAPHHPLQNRSIQNAHSPGSVFKIVMSLAGLAEGLVGGGDDKVWCGGSATFYNHRFRCWKRGGHGWVDLEQSLAQSCDVYFYQLGQRLGIERIAEYARRFRLGSPTGVDIAGERSGLVPDLEWSLGKRGHPWYPGETISVAIGQGPLLVTPLQLAVMMSAVATRGKISVPRLEADRPPAVAGEVRFTDAIWEVVERGLEEVVTDGGTGRLAQVEGLSVAGKTGTVQVVSQATWTDSADLPFEQRDHAWFASYAPVDAAELVVVVFVEHGGAGSTAAAPIARAIYEKFLEKRPDLRHLSPI